jgi:hypothetical protein
MGDCGHGNEVDVAWAFLADVVAELARAPSVSHYG